MCDLCDQPCVSCGNDADLPVEGEPYCYTLLGARHHGGRSRCRLNKRATDTVGWCRECRDEGNSEQARFIIWGELFPPESLGPRCYNHTAEHVGWSNMHRLYQWAVYELPKAALDTATGSAKPMTDPALDKVADERDTDRKIIAAATEAAQHALNKTWPEWIVRSDSRTYDVARIAVEAAWPLLNTRRDKVERDQRATRAELAAVRVVEAKARELNREQDRTIAALRERLDEYDELRRLAERCCTEWQDGEDSTYTQASALYDLEAWLRAHPATDGGRDG